ncbi:MAG: 6-carboxytetrahydropterin synthase QueD [Candidatus Binatia bacterium]
MRVELVKEFTFEAAHRLPHAPPGHKCTRLHGHSFRVAVTVEGEVDLRSQTGWLIDYGDIKQAMQPLLDQYLDHAYLNEVEGLENPTSECISKWIWDRLKQSLTGLKRISLYETCTSRCDYEGR